MNDSQKSFEQLLSLKLSKQCMYVKSVCVLSVCLCRERSQLTPYVSLSFPVISFPSPRFTTTDLGCAPEFFSLSSLFFSITTAAAAAAVLTTTERVAVTRGA